MYILSSVYSIIGTRDKNMSVALSFQQKFQLEESFLVVSLTCGYIKALWDTVCKSG